MTESEYRTFIAARYIAGLIVRHSAKNGYLVKDARAVAVFPARNQLLHGLCLELCPGSGFALWTPWGTWNFCDARIGQTHAPPIYGDMRLHVPEGLGLGSPTSSTNIYAVHEAAKLIFPHPKRRPEEHLLKTDAALKKWEQMSARYFERHPQD